MALMMIRFLIMYCPTSVNTKGVDENESLGRRTNGAKVKTICNNTTGITTLGITPKIKMMPITVSHTANN
jgi:hypothetical protein